jgi:hypothetical protein
VDSDIFYRLGERMPRPNVWKNKNSARKIIATKVGPTKLKVVETVQFVDL